VPKVTPPVETVVATKAEPVVQPAAKPVVASSPPAAKATPTTPVQSTSKATSTTTAPSAASSATPTAVVQPTNKVSNETATTPATPSKASTETSTPTPSPSVAPHATPESSHDAALRAVFRVGRRTDGQLRSLTQREAERATLPSGYKLLSLADVGELIEFAVPPPATKMSRDQSIVALQNGIAVLAELCERVTAQPKADEERTFAVDACMAELLTEVQSRLDSEAGAFGAVFLPTSRDATLVPPSLLLSLEQMSDKETWLNECRLLQSHLQSTLIALVERSPIDALGSGTALVSRFTELLPVLTGVRQLVAQSMTQFSAGVSQQSVLFDVLNLSPLYLAESTPRSASVVNRPLKPSMQFFSTIADFPPDPRARFRSGVHNEVDNHVAMLRRAHATYRESIGRLLRVMIKDSTLDGALQLFLRAAVLQCAPRAVLNAMEVSHNPRALEALLPRLPRSALCGPANNLCAVVLDLYKSRLDRALTDVDWRRALLLPRGKMRTMAVPPASLADDAIEAHLDRMVAVSADEALADTAEAAERAFARRDEARGRLSLDAAALSTTTFKRDTEMYFLSLHAVHVSTVLSFRIFQLTLTMQNQMIGGGVPHQMTAPVMEHSYRYATTLLDIQYLGLVFKLFGATCERLLAVLRDGTADIDGEMPLPADAARVLGSLPEWVVTDGYILLGLAARFDGLQNGVTALQQMNLRSAVELAIVLLQWRATLQRTQARGHVASGLRALLELARLSERPTGRESPSSRVCAEAFALSPQSTRRLVLGLVELFVRAAAVEGLDVDAEDFDLTHVRGDVAHILLDLYASAEMSSESVSRLAALDDALLRPPFVRELFEYMEHCVEDALHRMSDVADAGGASSPFVEQQKRAAGGFGGVGATMLRLLVHVVNRQRLTARPEPLVSSETAARCLAALLARLLTTAERGGEWVPGKPAREVVLDIALLTADVAHGDKERFAAVWRDCDDAQLLTRLVALLTSAELTSSRLIGELKAVVAAVEASRAAFAAAQADLLAVRRRVDAALASRANESATAAEAAFVAAMDDYRLVVTDDNGDENAESELLAHHHFRALAAKSNVGRKQLRLMSELERLSEALPLSREASIFVCVDGNRIDTWRALIMGPRGTPYALGLFEFHLYFPDDYPHVPPLMVLETTGSGSVRFNPNLYNNGKVCLSILGTWNAGDAVSRWQPDVSSAQQVLISVQAMILVADPYFNEPSYEQQRGTAAGKRASEQYSAKLRLHTLRHAIVAQLRTPPRGFEAAVHQYARTMAPLLREQAHVWREEARGSALEAAMQRESDALERELDRILNQSE
jgi:ubiquitin-protein ligase